MTSHPIIEIERNKPGSRSQELDDLRLSQLVADFVEERVDALRKGNRAKIEATYDNWGIESRDHSIAREDHERVSYFDWYINRLERGFDSDVRKVTVKKVFNANLPFRHNVTWPTPPEFELVVETAESLTSWFICFEDEKILVVLPNFASAPWNTPILETRGESVEFNGESFAKDLGDRLGLEFCVWAPRLKGACAIRAFTLDLDPSNGKIIPSLLTDRESFDESTQGKWRLGDWRLYSFTSTPNSGWPYGQELSDLVREYVRDKKHDHVHPMFDYWQQPREDFEVLLACAAAFKRPDFLNYLQRFDLSTDFELGVFHAHDEECRCNFARAENQDLSVLIKK
jgi:hypothetical protein